MGEVKKPPLIEFPRLRHWWVNRIWRRELREIIEQAEAEGWDAKQILAANRQAAWRKKQRLARL